MEDDTSLASSLARGLREQAYAVGVATDREDGRYPKDAWEGVMAEVTVGRDLVSQDVGRGTLERLAGLSAAVGATLWLDGGTATLVIPR